MNRVLLVLTTFVLPMFLGSCNVYRGIVHRKHAIDSAAIAAKPISDTAKAATVATTATKVMGPFPDTVLIPADTAAMTTPTASSATATALVSELAPLYTHTLDYSTFSGKAKMKYGDGDKSQDFTAFFRIRKDSVIWVTVTALGGMVQVARVCITPDSLRIINYLNREVVLMPMSQAAGLLSVPVKFQTLQNMIVGQPLVDSGAVTAASDTGNVWTLLVSDDHYNQQLVYSKADSTIHTGELETNNPAGPQGLITYNNYNEVSGHKFSDERDIRFVNAGVLYELTMNFASAAFDEPLDFPFSIPKSFTVK